MELLSLLSFAENSVILDMAHIGQTEMDLFISDYAELKVGLSFQKHM